MRSEMAAVKTSAINKYVHAEKERIINAFASSPLSKHRAITKVTKLILLNGPYLLNGRYWEVKAKSLGAGVYELSIERKET